MNYSGNMPDWHQYNPPQAGRTSIPGAVGQNTNSSQHLFIPGISPPGGLDGINLSTERHRTSKHQNETSYVAGRNYPAGTMSGTTVHMTTPLAGCVAHYGTTTRNSLIDGHLAGNSTIDPRMIPPVVPSVNEEVAPPHRNGQINFAAPPSNHSNVTNGMTVNTTNVLHSVGSQNSPIGSISPVRNAPVSYGTCKAPCCNPDPNNLPYQHWDKFPHYPNVSTAYRDNIRQSAYPIDNRRFLSDMNIRKDCHDNKDIVEAGTFPIDHRTGSNNTGNNGTSNNARNFAEYNKYTRKDSVVTRNYPPPSTNSLIHQNYPMQNYNFPSDYQKCPYTVKDYTRRGNNNSNNAVGSVNTKNSAIIKYHQEQSVIVQQKYHQQHTKQMQFQNGASTANSGTSLSSNNTGSSSNVVTSPLQNSYFNPPSQLPRDLSRDYSRDYHQTSQDQAITNNRMVQGTTNSHVHGTFQKYHVYHHKLAMQRYSVENHLRAYSRIPGYQSHPKYQECMMRYRELLRLQQTVDYQSIIQESPKVPSPASNGPVAPINLQFDQNGVLINSSYIHSGTNYPTGIHPVETNHTNIANSCSDINGAESSQAVDNRRIAGSCGNFESSNHYVEHRRDIDTTGISTLQDENPERYFMQTEKNDRNVQYENERLQNTNENLETTRIDVDDAIERTKSPENSTELNETEAYKNSKDFADKPELDVRQFLANWDESEDEDAGTNVNIANAEDDSTINEQEKSANSNVEINLPDKEEIARNSENLSSTIESSVDNNETVNNDNSSRENLNKTEIITNKNIDEMECIGTEEMDDIPTIHIVENLDCGTEMEKIHTVFGNLANLSTISIETGEIVSGIDNNENGETIVLFEHEETNVCTNTNDEVVEGVIASIIESSTLPESVTNQEPAKENEKKETIEKEVSKDYQEEPATIIETTNETHQEATVAPPTSASSTTISSSSTTLSYNSTDTNSVSSSMNSSSKTNTTDTKNLRKQNSFTSDESHNPDDISLPDLQTSECTPMSTTLNTPIQSDSEESSSEHVSDLTISTNPIEIIQNSPIISFTHSPIKIEPYGQLDASSRIVDRNDVPREHDSLDFDFDEEVASNENRKYNENCPVSPESVVQELENEARHSDAMRNEKNARDKENNEKNEIIIENYENVENREENFYRTADPLVGMAQITSRNVTNETRNLNNLNDESTNRCCEENANNANERIQIDNNESSTSIERENEVDFNRSEDLEKLCEMSLDDSCMIPLIPDDDCDEPRMPVSPMEGNCLTKILNDTMPITDLDMLESSDNIEKTNDDIWDEVRNIENHFGDDSITMSIESKKENTKKLRKIVKRNNVITRLDKSLSSSPTKFQHKINDKNINDTSQNEITTKTSNFNEMENETVRISNSLESEEIFQNNYKDCRDRNFETLKCTKITTREKFDDSSIDEETKKCRISCDERRFSRDEKETLENMRKDTSDESQNSIDTKNYFAKHCDSNVEIQVANLNVKIHNDNETTRKDSTCTKKIQENVDAIEAIEIKINLSRGDRRINKSTNEKFNEEETKDETKKISNSSIARLSGNICCRRRRRSMPDTNNEKSDNNDNYGNKKISKYRSNVNSCNRRKIRRSMDDDLLPINEKLSRKDFLSNDETNYEKETTKIFNVAWQNSETIDDSSQRSSLTKTDEESIINKKLSYKNKIDSRIEKYTKDSISRLPSPSYNSSLETSSTLDFDNFDVAPNRHSGNSDNDIVDYNEKKLHNEEHDRYKNFDDDLTSRDAFEINLNTVPIYTTKDGRITYSPNRNYTYRALIIEARQREKRYSRIGKFHYTRNLSRNNYRDTQLRKNHYKKRLDDNKINRTNNVDIRHNVKSKRSKTPTRTSRSNERTKNDNRRTRETRVSSELLEKYSTNEETSRIYIENETRPSSIVSSSLKSDKSLLKNFISSRKSVDTKNREIDTSLRNFTTTKINENVLIVDDTLRSPKQHFGMNNRENEKCLVSKIFQGQELEISSSSKNAIVSPERQNVNDELEECEKNPRFFQDNSHLTNKTPMASPMTTINTIEKRTIGGWDLDCQTALSDSGLESSTTYIEARKESRKIQRWRNSSFIENRIDNKKSIYSIDVRNDYVDRNDDLSLERSSFTKEIDENLAKIVENERLRYYENETNISKTSSNEISVKMSSKPIIEIDETEKNVNLKTDVTTLIKSDNEKLTKTINNLENHEMSEIVKSLDLAITSKTIEEMRKKKYKKIEDIEKPKILENLDRVSKILNGTFRRISSDGISGEETRRSFFQTSTQPEILEEQTLKIIPDDSNIEEEENEEEEEEENSKDPIELENTNVRMTTTMSEELPDNSLTRENFHQTYKDFSYDSCTSFSSCMKIRVPEPVSELPTESEASQLEDTSTRFASESMDFKEFSEKENIKLFSGETLMIDNDTNGRDSLFGSIAENAINASNESDRSKESNSGKAPILSFSGQLQNETRLVESPSKSPPDLTCEDSIPKLVIRKNEISSKPPILLYNEKFELPILDNEITKKHAEHEIQSHPKIPKMIIRNVKSRPGTPTGIEDNETPETMKNFINQPQIFEVSTKFEKNVNTRIENGECKIPKMKIKLEDKQLPRMITDIARGSKTEESSRLKIKKVRKSSSSRSPIRVEKFQLVGKLSRQSSENETRGDFTESMENSNVSSSYKFTLMEKSISKHHHHHHHHQSSKEKILDDKKQDKIPKLTIKKQDVPTTNNSTYSSSHSINKKRRSRSPGESSSKKQRRSGTSKLIGGNGNKKEETRSRERRRNSLDSNEGNTDSHQSLSEKIPKVIIKRTSPSAEFKCELSKNDREAITKDSKWQPEVKLQRSWVLDCMAKEPGNSQVALKVLESTMENVDWEKINKMSRKNRKWKRSSSDSLIRNISPLNDNKTRRKSDCDDRTRLFSNNTKRRKSLDETIEFSDNRPKFKSIPITKINETSRISSNLKINNFPFSTSRSESPVDKLENHRDEKKDTTKNNEKRNDDSCGKSIKKTDDRFDETVNSVIKLDSSDESQTTIEILPASPDNSQPELEISNQSFQIDHESNVNGNMGKLYSEDAIPTQFELELEIVDNSTIDSLDIPLPLPDHESCLDDDTITKVKINKSQNFDSHRSCENEERRKNHEESKKIFSDKDRTSSSMIVANMKNICCSDSLVKEVLAAKETLKRCLTKTKDTNRQKSKPRPKTAAEKKQGSGYGFVDMPDFGKSWKCDNVENVKSLKTNKSCCFGDRKKSVIVTTEKRESRLENINRIGENSKSSWINEEINESTTILSKQSSSSSNSTTMKIGKLMKLESFGENSRQTSTSVETRNEKISIIRRSSKSIERIDESNHDNREDSISRKSYKIPKISQSRERNYKSDETKVEDEKRKSPSPVKMPILEPQIDMKFELVGSDRDTSRSPPVITKQEEPDIDDQTPKKIDEKVNLEKLDNVTKQRETETVTFADIVSQLAYHEKATIRHRRYCTLCERWFPTAARHRRHLTGYQHRHTELTQRRTVHALFMLFTGKPCPRLLPASIVRTDCLPGEPTPLQIAVQDVAISLEDGARVKPNKDLSKKDE